ncbi:MAG: helical backbone metal receptor [Myxococcota bacterium]
MITVVDSLGRTVRLDRPASRVVSLVPSETLSVVELAGLGRLVGRTDYCVEPPGAIEALPSVGGTKGVDVDAVIALRPDLVLANKEENSRASVRALIEAGLAVHVSFPCTVDESNEYLRSLCELLGVAADAKAVSQCERALERALRSASGAPLPVFVPIWKEPWMTFDDRVFASDMLRACGAENVFSDRARRYPLAADLGKRSAWNDDKVADRDTRYPRIQLTEVATRGARAVLLPDEPYAFSERDSESFEDLGSNAIHVTLVDGKDLFWYGTRVAQALDNLSATIARLASEL